MTPDTIMGLSIVTTGIISAVIFHVREVRRKRRVEMLQKRIEESARKTYQITPLDMIAIRELIEGAHQRPTR